MRKAYANKNIYGMLRALLCAALVFTLCACGRMTEITGLETPEGIPEENVTVSDTPEDASARLHAEKPVDRIDAKPSGQPVRKPEEEPRKPAYEFPEGSIIPMGSTAGISFGERLKDYCCVDLYLGDISYAVSLRESGGLLYYGFTDSAGSFYEVSREIGGADRVVYLTFDDGPGPYTGGLLDTLKKYDAKATFFVVGYMGPLDIIKRMEDEGHSVGAHTYSHDFRTCYSSVEAYYEDLQKIEDLISEQLGHETPLVRFPGGSSNGKSASYCRGIMTKLTQDLPEKGYQYFDWNVTAADSGGTEDTEDVIRLVKEGIQSHKVSVVLQHDIKPYSVAGVEEILRWGKSKGYIFLPLNKDSTPAHFEHLHN